MEPLKLTESHYMFFGTLVFRETPVEEHWSRKCSRPVTSLGHQAGRRVFWVGPKVFKLCPIFLNYVQHTFPGGTKNFAGELLPSTSPLVTGLQCSLSMCRSRLAKAANLLLKIVFSRFCRSEFRHDLVIVSISHRRSCSSLDSVFQPGPSVPFESYEAVLRGPRAEAFTK